MDLPTGNVTLTADRPIRPAEIRNAVEAAGYELAET